MFPDGRMDLGGAKQMADHLDALWIVTSDCGIDI